jgi:CheY-like chemotaxis protein
MAMNASSVASPSQPAGGGQEIARVVAVTMVLRLENAPMAYRILIVEDEPAAAEPLRRFLESLGHDVKVAGTGPDGLALAREWLPDFALCDIALPGLSGWELARELRQDPKTANVHLLAITGHSSEEDRHRSKEAGFEKHLVKPVDPAVLTELLV